LRTEANVGSLNFELKTTSYWSFFRSPEFEDAGILHGFCTGGSPSDLSHHDGKQAFLDAFSLRDLVIMNQEHGADVHVISDGQRPVSGDGLIITEKKVAGIVKTADCLPIILGDAVHPVVSIIHAGWRGTVKGIVANAILAMERLGSRRRDIVAFLGPSIGSCCYEVKGDVHSIFTRNGFPVHIFHERDCALFLDLKEANSWVLDKEGVGRVYNLGMCTRCQGSLFHSFRRGDTGKRQINFVSLKG
jgi:YfiH family protein